MLPHCSKCGLRFPVLTPESSDSEEEEAYEDMIFWTYNEKHVDELQPESRIILDPETKQYKAHFGCRLCHYRKLLDIRYIIPCREINLRQLAKDVLIFAKTDDDVWAKAVVLDVERASKNVTIEWIGQNPKTTAVRSYLDLKLVMIKDSDDKDYPASYPYCNLREFLTRAGFPNDSDVIQKDAAIPIQLQKDVQECFNAIPHRSRACVHPGSRYKFDLAHPSDYCYVKGTSRLKTGQIETLQDEKSPFQWLPSEFKVDANGKVQILSYINGLPEIEENPSVYRAIEQMFECFLPHFETCLGESLVDRQLQVIFKAVDYMIKPQDCYEGEWHYDGMIQEKIVATGIYCMSQSESLEDHGVSFRREINAQETLYFANHYRNRIPPPFTATRELKVGTVLVPEGRMLVWPNRYQHKCLPLRNHGNETCCRRLFTFFLIDPSNRIVSTSDVPDQRWDNRKRKLEDLLQEASKGHYLPDLVIHNMFQYARHGFSVDQERQHRYSMVQQRFTNQILSESNMKRLVG